MKKTPARLADGREIIYFDETDDAVRELYDSRELPPAHTLSQVRYDPLLAEWVAIASHRQSRTFLPPTSECPLDPSTKDRLTEIPSPAYDVVVFENRFPSFTTGGADEPVPSDDGTVVTRRPGAGRCEVVCFTSDHDSSFSQLTPERVRTVVDVWADRTETLNALPFVEQVFCFENRGEEIGVTLDHPHGQIYAYPFVTPRTRRMLDSAHRHRDRTGENLFARVLADEQRIGERIVASNEHWTAFVPAFARWPFEVHLYPHRQVPGIPELSDAERDSFGPIYLDVLRRFDALFDTPMPYISAWHQAPARVDRDLAYLHLQLFSIRREAGKLKYLAGSESGMGVFINDIPPERSAALLREATAQ
ncbi:galactose-1-phosphate uridylyltransferase [Fodinicola feengrottensis]|uniref:Galactose-1-phosphate uridylyltransferase n=1 Tax=Fodinicola feengrottensis TaxID=435914 RepID=A0ABN2HDE5_9ACTN